MSNDPNVVTHDEVDTDLYHYGVLGMKWGVRRGSYSKTYAKSTKKLKKLNVKSTNTRLKAAKLEKKALTKETRATSEKQYQKARELQFKANKLNLKSAKLQKKGMKFEQKMAKAFADVKVSDISPEDLNAGRKYAYMLIGGPDENKKKK